MNDSFTRDIRVSEEKNLPLKRCWSFGTHTLVAIDDSIVQRLGITDDTYVEEEITQNGILLKLKKLSEYLNDRNHRS